jgi:hypothetical protein
MLHLPESQAEISLQARGSSEQQRAIDLENYWLLSALAGLYDDLAGRLEEWKKSAV